jgi:chromosome partitioning protein
VKVGVMQGSLREFQLAEVLQVVGIGRQYTGVELQLANGVVGTIFVKSGPVVSATADDAAGSSAFFNLFQASDGRFFVFRTETPADLPEPLGPLNRLLMEVPPPRAAKSEPVQRELPTRTGVAPPSAGAPAPVHPFTQSSALKAPPSPSRRPPPSPSVAAPSPSASTRIIAVVSPKGGSGKSTISLNLSLSLARRGNSVVLVDADVNGDVLSAINARSRATIGALDVVYGEAPLDEALLETVMPRLKILPAVGATLPDAELMAADYTPRWRKLLMDLSQRVEVVVVDTPAGMFGHTRSILSSATHVLGVLQAEVIAARSFQRFAEGLASLRDGQRPQVLGVVLNMLQTRHHASLSVFQEAMSGLPNEWLFDTTIPRHPAFLEATHQGLPLRHLDNDTPPPVAFLFDNLAAEVGERLKLSVPEAKPRPFLL